MNDCRLLFNELGMNVHIIGNVFIGKRLWPANGIKNYKRESFETEKEIIWIFLQQLKTSLDRYMPQHTLSIRKKKMWRRKEGERERDDRMDFPFSRIWVLESAITIIYWRKWINFYFILCDCVNLIRWNINSNLYLDENSCGPYTNGAKSTAIKKKNFLVFFIIAETNERTRWKASNFRAANN